MSEQPVFVLKRKSSPTAVASYWIPKHVRVCATPNGGVILDLLHDRYIGVTREQMQVLSAMVEDWPLVAFSTARTHSTMETEESNLTAELLAKGLLTCNRADAHAAASSQGTLAAPALFNDFDDVERGPVTVAHIWNFLMSIIAAAWSLRFRSLQSIVDGVTARKQRAARSGVTFDTRKAVQLVAVFKRLRSFAYSGRGRCLFEALVLFNFLAHHRLFPLWVFGVATAPFKAHAWIQHENVVLGASPQETYFSYTPILIV